MKAPDSNRRNLIHTAIGIVIVLSTITMLSIASPPMVMAQTTPMPPDQPPTTSTGPSLPFTSFPGSMSGLPTQMGPAFGNETGKMTFLGAFGVSMVKGVQITGISKDDASRTVTVTLSSNATGNSPGVTVEAFKTNFNLMSLIQESQKAHQEMMMGSMAGGSAQSNASSSMMMAMPGETGGSSGMMFGPDQNMTTAGSEQERASPFNIMSLFENLQSGSNVVQKGWTSPQQVSITLQDNNTSPRLSQPTDSTLIFVSVVPFTGGAQNMTATTTASPTTLPPSNMPGVP